MIATTPNPAHLTLTLYLCQFCRVWRYRAEETFLGMFAPVGAGRDNNQAKAVMDSMKSAEDFLRMDLPVSTTTATSNAISESTTANHKFRDDPLYFQYLIISAGETRGAIEAFHTALANVGTFFYNEPLKKFVQLEGDVVDVCLVNILIPVVRVMNEVLTAWYDGGGLPKAGCRIVSIRAQYQPPGLVKDKSFIDHVLILVQKDLQDISAQHVLVIFEAKKVMTMDPAKWHGQVERCRQRGYIKLYSDSGNSDLTKMISQVRKYVFGSHCPYALLSDSINHRAMIWDKAHGWPHTSHSFDLAGKYPGNRHMYGHPQGCQVIKTSKIVSNTSGETIWPARYTLAFLCYLALRDHELLT
ncbi:hypothetical protein JB92DRAFT_443568 [Gautieria morchelliformis]|nr:hypothetical protein JB92DRAFT_443568 [Gautieria morchelliformis]